MDKELKEKFARKHTAIRGLAMELLTIVFEFFDEEGYVVVKKEQGAFCHNGFYYPEKGKGNVRIVKCGNWKEKKE